MDAAEPPRIVFVSPAPCHERDRAEETLRRSLASALAPRRGWSVAMRVDRDSPQGLRAEGDIVDGEGASVAHRTIVGAADCPGLARAVGVWATLVLDDQRRKATTDGGPGADRTDLRDPAPTAPGPSEATAAATETRWVASGVVSEQDWPPDIRTPEHDWYLHHDENARTLELGGGAFLMTGTGGGSVGGPTAFVVVEAGHGVYLRPSLAYGEAISSLPSANVKASTWGAARLDTCLRLPGLYSRRHGMQLDLCGGADLGYSTIQTGATTIMPYLDLGPSIDLRGELGSRLASVLRVVGGVNVVRTSFVDQSGASQLPPIATLRLELAVSWEAR